MSQRVPTPCLSLSFCFPFTVPPHVSYPVRPVAGKNEPPAVRFGRGGQARCLFLLLPGSFARLVLGQLLLDEVARRARRGGRATLPGQFLDLVLQPLGLHLTGFLVVVSHCYTLPRIESAQGYYTPADQLT